MSNQGFKSNLTVNRRGAESLARPIAESYSNCTGRLAQLGLYGHRATGIQVWKHSTSPQASTKISAKMQTQRITRSIIENARRLATLGRWKGAHDDHAAIAQRAHLLAGVAAYLHLAQHFIA